MIIRDKQFIRNMLSGPVGSGLAIIATIIAYPIYLRYLGLEVYGDWLVLSTVLAVAQLGNLGIQPTIIKLVAEVIDDKPKVELIISNSLFLIMISGSLILLFILIFESQILSLFNLSEANYLIVSKYLPYVGVLSIFVIIVQTLTSVLAGIGRYDITNYLMSINRMLIVGLASLLLIIGYNIESLVIANIIAYIVIFVIVIILLRSKFNGLGFFRPKYISAKEIRNILKFGFPIMGGSIVSLFISPFNKLIISRYIGVEFLPIYEISFNGTMQIRNFFESGLKTLLPKFSSINSNSIIINTNYLRSVFRPLFILSVPVYLSVFIFTDPILSLWLGNANSIVFADSFRIILIGTFFSLIGVVSYYYIIAIGKPAITFRAHIIQASTNVVLILITTFLFKSLLSVQFILTSLSLGMFFATVYLIWQHIKFAASKHRESN